MTSKKTKSAKTKTKTNPHSETRLTTDLTFEEAVKKLLQAPPEQKLPKRRQSQKKAQPGSD
jgi:hypothetical protein